MGFQLSILHTCCRSKSVRPSLVQQSPNTSFFKIPSVFSMVVANGLTVHGCISDSGGSAMNKRLSNVDNAVHVLKLSL